MNSDALPAPSITLMRTNRRILLGIVGVLSCVATLPACDSGSLGSEVGNQESEPPVAEAAIIGHDNLSSGGAVTAVVRSGSEVVLTGANSYGTDGPIVKFEWEATNAEAQAVELITRSSNAVSFTAPFVGSQTALNFSMTVTDADGEQATADVVVTVEPFPDPDHFLSYTAAPSSFTVVAASGQPLSSDTGFEVSVSLRVIYPDRQGILQTFNGPAEVHSGTWLSAVGSDPNDPSFFGNPNLSFDIPSIDLDEINLAYVNLPPGDPNRQRILDPDLVGAADASVVITLTTRGDASAARIFVPGAAAPGGTPLQSVFNGTAQELIVPLDELVAQPADPTAQPYESPATAELYYNAIDPGFERTTLRSWLLVNCFDPDAEDFGADAHAVYLNNFDLGFGRDMYLKRGSECSNGSLAEGNLASVVLNYTSLLGAAKKLDPIVAVAMEYTPALAPFDAARSPNDPFTKFYIFVRDESSGEFVRTGSANFDGRGEKYVPGVCSACHGGQPKPIQAGQCANGLSACYASGGDIDAMFMPWDLDSFLFTGPDGDPHKDSSLPPTTQPFLSEEDLNALNTYTRENQQDAFRELNEAVLMTYPDDAPVRKLVHDWYHDPASGAAPDYLSNELAGPFHSGIIPAGWQDVLDDPDNRLYLGVIAQNCRACHTQLVQGGTARRPSFENFEDFDKRKATVSDIVFRRGLMPLSRLTMDRFWVDYEGDSSSAAEILASHVAISPGIGQSSASITVLEPFPTDCTAPVEVGRNQTVKLDGSGSSFLTSATWDLAYSGGPGSSAALVGANGLEPAFETDTFGQWTASLEVTGPDGTSATAACVISVVNEVPRPPANFVVGAVSEGDTITGINLLQAILGEAACASESCFGDEPAIVTVNVASPNSRGTIQVVDAATGTFNYTSTQAATAGPGIIGYTITDLDGDIAVGTVQINVTSLAGPTAAADNATVAVNTTVQPIEFVFGTNGPSLLQNDGGGVSPLSVTAATQGSLGGSVTVAVDGSNRVTYVPAQFATGTETFTYTVRDANSVAPKSDTATVTITLARQTTFAGAGSVQTVLSSRCSGCHGYGGFNAAEPNWSLYSNVAAHVNVPDGPGDTGDAPASQILTVPCTGTLPGGGVHPGGSNLLAGCPPAALSPGTDYGIIRRWIEEGASSN